MPHFLIDCSENIMTDKSKSEIMKVIHEAAVSSELFDPQDIKIRIRPFDEFMVGGTNESFIHVFSHIMQGRSIEQKAMLSRKVVQALTEIFSDVEFIAMNVDEFEKATYTNKAML
jgi:5-carboxymethyl-2-hydroxymuconate isomerase